MKNLLTVAFIFAFAYSATADEFEKKYGSGVVHISTDSIYSIEFYSSPESAITHRLEFLPVAWSLTTNYPMLDSSANFPSWFVPLFMTKSAEYSRVDIIARDSSKGFYRTVLKDDQGREVWLKKTKHARFLTWFGFYCTMANIEPSSDEIILYTAPNDNAAQVNYTNIIGKDNPATMRPLEVQFFWMKVEMQVQDPDPAKPSKVYTGWIKWRNEKEPLIKYNLMGC